MATRRPVFGTGQPSPSEAGYTRVDRGTEQAGTGVGEIIRWILLAVALCLIAATLVFAILAFVNAKNAKAEVDGLQACCANNTVSLLAVLADLVDISIELDFVTIELEFISDSVETLLDCCETVSAGVTSLISSVALIYADTQELLALECAPLYSIPSGGLVLSGPGCVDFQNDVSCSLTAVACITVASHGVTINGRGFDLNLGPNSTGLAVSFSPEFALSDLRIINAPPSNYPANAGLVVIASPGASIERVTFNGSCNGALFYDTDSLRIDGCLFTEIKHINASSGVNNYVNPMVVFGGNGVALVDTDFVHVDGTLAASPAFNSFFQDSAFAFFGSQTTGLPVQGLNIDRVNVIDGAYVFLAPVAGGTVRDLHLLVQNPGSIYNMMEITFGPPDTESLLIKDCSFRNDVANAAADGVICNRCTGVTFDNVEIAFNGAGLLPYDPSVTGPAYAYFGAALHMNSAFSASYHHTQSNAGATMVGSGCTIKNSHLIGALTSQATQRGRLGLFVDGNYEQVHVIDTIVENFGGYVPANASANVPQVPGGAIVVSPGNRGVRVSGCKIYGSANGSPQGGNGILFMGQTNATVLPVFGSGTSVWPAAANCTAVDNQLFDNAGYAILDAGAGTVLFGNLQAGNWAGSYSSINSPVVVAPGAAALAGQNV